MTRILDEESDAVQTHLTILQGIIQRMADNSRSCKVWCVTLVAAILILIARTGQPQHVLIALIPTILLLVLDSYYLAQERAFRKSYSVFVNELSKGKLTTHHIYRVSSTGMGIGLVLRCFGSVSIWLFYPLLVVTILAARILIIPSTIDLTQGGI